MKRPPEAAPESEGRTQLAWPGRFAARPRARSAVVVAACVAAAGLVLLAFLPRVLRMTPHVLLSHARTVMPMDALGVARDDFVCGDEQHVLLYRFIDDEVKTVWQVNFPTAPHLTGVMDLMAEGLDQVSLAVGDSTGARAILLDAAGREVATFGPIGGRSARPGYAWDGLLYMVAPLQQEGAHKAIGLVCTTFARAPRGVALFDVATRRQEWCYAMGTYPGEAVPADLDGDGRPEILVTTSAPDNGAVANGSDDAHCYLLALDTHGHRLWQTTMGGAFAASYAAVLPPGKDGHVRVAAAFESHRAHLPEPWRVLILDGRSGRVLARREFAAGFSPPRVLGVSGTFVVGSRGGELRVFDADLRLLAERRFAGDVAAWAPADLDGDGGPEVIASCGRDVWVLDDRLRTRGRLRLDGGGTGPARVMPARAGLGRCRLAIGDGRAVVADVVPTAALADPTRLAVVLALALTAGLGRLLWRTPRRWQRLPAGAAAREFLVDYLQIRHESFGRERPFARVRLWLQAHTSGQSPPAEMFESACEEFARIGLPTLLRFADRARALRADRAAVRRVRDLAREVSAALGAARELPVEKRPEVLESTLARIGELSETCAEMYWDIVMRRPCRPDQVAQEALLAKRPTLEAAGVATRFAADAGASAAVLFDRDELRALLGELLENSARALHGMPGAEVRVSVSLVATDPRWVQVRICDNGPGIPPERREAVFAAENASRPDGGFGLFHAREVARRWLGELTLENPESGTGAVVRLLLRACRVEPARARAGTPKGGMNA